MPLSFLKEVIFITEKELLAIKTGKMGIIIPFWDKKKGLAPKSKPPLY